MIQGADMPAVLIPHLGSRATKTDAGFCPVVARRGPTFTDIVRQRMAEIKLTSEGFART